MDIKTLLEAVRDGKIKIDTALELLPYDSISNFAKLDRSREKRTGYPEVIYTPGKEPDHAAEIFKRLATSNNIVIATRVNKETGEKIIKLSPKAIYHPIPKLVIYKKEDIELRGCVSVVTAGTADIAVAEETALILEAYGSFVKRIYDVGIAAIDRLLAHIEDIRKSNCIVVIAGMEGALPSVVAGLVDIPTIALPTSVGYGANLNGFTTLMAILSSCTPGIATVNIDNGFGAAHMADMINKMALKTTKTL